MSNPLFGKKLAFVPVADDVVGLNLIESVLVVAAVKSAVTPVCVNNDVPVGNLVPHAFVAKVRAAERFHVCDPLSHLEIAIDHLRQF